MATAWCTWKTPTPRRDDTSAEWMSEPSTRERGYGSGVSGVPGLPSPMRCTSWTGAHPGPRRRQPVIARPGTDVDRHCRWRPPAAPSRRQRRRRRSRSSCTRGVCWPLARSRDCRQPARAARAPAGNHRASSRPSRARRSANGRSCGTRTSSRRCARSESSANRSFLM